MDIPTNVNEAAKRLRAVKACDIDPAVIVDIYKDVAEAVYSAIRNDRRALADWLLETFQEVGR